MQQTAFEMAYTRSDAIDRCAGLGKQFSSHFVQVCSEGKNSLSFAHHCTEMQAWWDDVKSIRLSHNNKYISISNLTDWFFTHGQDPEDFIPEQYLNVYFSLYLQLLFRRDDAQVSEILPQLL